MEHSVSTMTLSSETCSAAFRATEKGQLTRTWKTWATWGGGRKEGKRKKISFIASIFLIK